MVTATEMAGSGLKVHATTACLPTQRYEEVATRLAEGLDQAPWGRLSIEHVQLCPQHPFHLTEALLDEISACLPSSQLRLHATVPVQRQHVFGPAAWWSDASQPYWTRVAHLSRHIKAKAYTFHAGTRDGHTFDEMLDQACRFEQLFECPVGIEGLYPDASGKQSWFVDSWLEYRTLMESGVRYAIDLSHLNIVAKQERHIDHALLNDLVSNPRCIEIHVSDNDGFADTHRMIRPMTTSSIEGTDAMWWMTALTLAAECNPGAVVFSESSRPWRPSQGVVSPMGQGA